MIYTGMSWPDELITDVPILKRPKGKRVGSKTRKYLDIIGAFDIETTLVRDHYSVLWIWQLQIGLYDTIIGRSWKEFTRCMKRISSLLPEDVFLVLYVHNLSYEFQFLRGVYKFKPEEIFAVQPRKPLRVDMYDHIELRCSYLHTNMRLDTFLKKMGVPDQKLTLDYTKKRYPWTKLSQDEIDYCIHDVRGLVQALYIEFNHDGDSLYTVPATSTGYVRRDVKKAMRQLPYGYIKSLLPGPEIYGMLREAFRGGNTHANRYFVGQVIPGTRSMDEASAYPACQLMDQFPIRPFRRIGPCSLDKAEDLIYRRKRAVLMRVAVWGAELRDKYWGCPYLATDKLRRLTGAKIDNGRILSATYFETTITDIDYKIMLEEYNTDDIHILDLAHSGYGPLPECLKEVIRTYYTLKTELKGNAEEALLYEKSKNKLNAIYGMSCTDPAKQDIIYVGGEEPFDFDDKTIEQLIEDNNKNAFFPYQWGVWTTAHARRRLEAGIRLAHEHGEYLYCDTDSVKYAGDVDFSTYNNEVIAAAEKAGAYADRDGKRYYMGVYEPDDGYPTYFATRGAKKYVVLDPKTGCLKATIAGVNKREDGVRISGGMELMEHGGFDAFLRPVFVFQKAAAPKSLYNDTQRFMIREEGKRLKVRECVSIVENTYNLHDTREYADLLSEIKKDEIYYFRKDFFGK